MYQKFDILGISISLKDKKVYVECTLDVDEATVTVDTITLTSRGSNRIVDYNLVVNGQIIELDLKEWPVPNTEYLLTVQPGIKSITDESLVAALKRKIIFPSETTSTIVITSPSDYEEISALNLAWDEKLTDKNMELVHSYYIEVAKENAFYNIVKATNVYDKNEINLMDIQDGQYYVRIRAQQDGQYGRWSDTVTFLYQSAPGTPTPPDPSEDSIYDGELVVTAAPVNGETPNSFLIEFDEPIDMDSLEVIVTRRKL